MKIINYGLCKDAGTRNVFQANVAHSVNYNIICITSITQSCESLFEEIQEENCRGITENRLKEEIYVVESGTSYQGFFSVLNYTLIKC
ncbi:hypothetical protein V1478_001521 [Vespula squamosa]|uniref:Uncharacterized protein n=1 Tax=Vespula squamosa TaxID=30214 RepID=A0ABD2C281_VESSQ